ncbi:hypothetical protein B4U80_11809 [Leptotrombidium deliense]|uniref:Peptidase S1 domain-containing protein n=1 Tax=Leptotrombidium deliense TaxID=299467 RepID=A0A443S2C7_9ACAR|nr:hypothetical protein B4U80_11809 [Leptotrombidium deliense]
MNIAGVVINSLYVLTIASPFLEPYDHITVYYGKYLRSELKNGTEVDKVFVHKDFSSILNHKENDIALLKLKYEIQFNEDMRPICIFHSFYEEIHNTFTIASFGSLSATKDGSLLATNMQEISMYYVQLGTCKKTYPNYVFSFPYNLKTSKHICATSSERHVCRGDAGATLMLKYHKKMYAAGLLSFSRDLCTDTPAVFTNVGTFGKWIKDHTKDGKYCE